MSTSNSSDINKCLHLENLKRDMNILEQIAEDEDEDFSEESHITWSNLLFLPFHPVFKFIVLLSVITKSIFGPLQMVYPIIYCWDVLDHNIYLWLVKVFYIYACDPIYGIDTCLHIMHRQVTDEAMRREFLPKSALLLFIDILCLIPFFRLMVRDVCTELEFWPNILSALEFVTIYRVADYFSLLTTHDYVKLSIGFTLMYFITINCISCFFLLLTYVGLCGNCHDEVYFKDWRKYIMHKINHNDEIYSTYIYGSSLIFSFPLNIVIEEIKASTLTEYVFFSMLMVFCYLMQTFIILPKMVAETLLQLKRIFTFYPRVQIIIAETKRRNPSPVAYIDVKNFYALMWKQHGGVTRIPSIISELPRYLRVEIKVDLVWSVFYHSPTFRRTSNSYQKWLCDYIHLEYKLPGSRFYVGPQCQTHLYYIKSGIVQLISTDDGATPIISVTSGTVFGDIGFFASPLKRKVVVRCLTYCEVFYISRTAILKSLHKFPEDRRLILQRVKDKLKHAHTLYMCKMHVRGLDRAEDEGIAWIKRRWWEISKVVSHWKKKESQNKICFELPAEDAIYHCSKYIGQLVLCKEAQLRRNSLFVNLRFPLILAPNSSFCMMWHKIVVLTVIMVLMFYPPNITRTTVPIWFNFFRLWADFVYVSDVCVSLVTSMEIPETARVNFATVMFARFKSLRFCIDFVSAMWFENLMTLIGLSQYYYTVQFNRVLKMYVLFPDWNFGRDPLFYVFLKVCLIHVTFVYVFSYFIFSLVQIIPELSSVNFFGEKFCKLEDPKSKCNFEVSTDVLQVFVSWLIEYLFADYQPQNLSDVYTTVIVTYMGFLIFLYCKAALIGTFHSNITGISNYQYFVTNITKHYKQFHIHPDLLKRLHRYLMCHWKYFRGMDVLYPNLLEDEPYDIYWKVHGEVAEKIIAESRGFLFADRGFVKEIAYHSKFVMLPQNSTVIVFGHPPKDVKWLVQGYIKCEYHNERAELVRRFYNPGKALAFATVLFAEPSLRTYVAYTECEILYLSRTTFFKILSHYPNEWSRFKFCLDEFKPRFGKLIQEHVKKYKDYQKKIRKQIFHSRVSIVKRPKPQETVATESFFNYDLSFGLRPDSDFILYWMLFRMLVVCVSLIAMALQGGAGASRRRPLMIICAFCDCIALADITLKFFMSYYDERGLLITDFRARVKHYLGHNFLLDLVGTLPAQEIYAIVSSKVLEEDDALLLNTFSRFAHLYIVIGCFDYWADKPTSNIAYIMILKWQVISLLLMFAASHFFIRQCINFDWDSGGELINATLISKCWLPSYTHFTVDNIISHENISMIFAQSLNLAQSGLLRIDLGMFYMDQNNIGTATVLLLLGCSFWYVLCYCLTLLVLNARVNTLYQQGVLQLKRFLEAERVETQLIDSVQEHFKYVWQRTKGIDVQKLISKRIGVVFRQDLTFYFFKTTISSLNTLLQGGEEIERQLATVAKQIHFSPGSEIVREMDLAPSVYVVHRGKVLIKRNGDKLAILTKGAIFGQLDGVNPRPVRISAEAEGYADVLEIPIADFQEALSDEIRVNIEHNTQSKLDFMALKKLIIENPYNTIQYIIRGKKSIKLPWMKTYMEATDGSWYSRWLFIAWFIEPTVTAVVVLTLETVPNESAYKLYSLLVVLDVIHFLYFISEFFTMELTVVGDECVMRLSSYRKLLNWSCYADIVTLILPLITFGTGNWLYQFVRLIRLRLFYDFYCYFCTGFQSRVAPILLKSLSVVMVLHAMTCGWMMIACRDAKFPINISEIPADINATIDYDEWARPSERKGGCARMTIPFKVGNKYLFSFMVPRTWGADYIVSMTYVLVLYTQTEMDSVLALNIRQVYYKIFINAVIHLLDIWILSIAISAVYTKLHELYKYDYKVEKLLTYLKHTGLSPAMLQTVEDYTKHLWQRQRGNWLPELVHSAPQCLREDIFGSLYLYHLKTPPLLRDLPDYFLRQLVARLNRVVIFPGKLIIREGDIYSCIYFIHEGEVEKWGTDKSGEKKMLGLLNTNDYFGFIPGLFPNSPFRYTYVTRTVVDVVFLRYKDWQDLLQGYPKVKYDLYTAAMQYKKEIGSN